MTSFGHPPDPRENSAIAALMDPVALEARLADARTRRAQVLSDKSRATQAPHRKLPTAFLAGLALGVAAAIAALSPFLLRPEPARIAAIPPALPVVAPAPASAPEPEPLAATATATVTLLALRPEPRPADLRPAPIRQVSARNTPARTATPRQPVLLTAIIRQGRVIETSADAGLRHAVRTADRFVTDLGQAIPKPARKALREALRVSPGQTPKAPRKD